MTSDTPDLSEEELEDDRRLPLQCQQSGGNGAFSSRTATPHEASGNRTSGEEDDMAVLQGGPTGPGADPLLLTPEEAAQVLRLGRTTIYALMKAGELRPVHIGRSCRLARAELERYVDRLRSPARPAPDRGRRHTGTTPAQDRLFEVVHTPPDVP